MSTGIRTVVDAWVKLGKFSSLEREKSHRQGLLDQIRETADFKMDLIRQTLEQDINVIEIGLAEQFRDAELDYHIDIFNNERIDGWAQYKDFRETPVVLSIFFDDTLIGTTIANRFRPDLFAAGLGSGNHGFAFRRPDGASRADVRSVEVRAAGGLVLGRLQQP